VIAAKHHLLHTAVLLSLVLAGCSGNDGSQRIILEHNGRISGQVPLRFSKDVRAGDTLQVVLTQSGLDLELRIRNGQGTPLERYESFTERYGEERVQVEVRENGPLEIVIGSHRLPEVSGPYRLKVERVAWKSSAEAAFTRASRIDAALSTEERVRLFWGANAGFASAGRKRQAGLAALAAATLLNETASDSRRAMRHASRAVAAFTPETEPLLRATSLLARGASGVEAIRSARATHEDLHKESAAPPADYASERPYFSEARSLYESQGAKAGTADVDLTIFAQNFDDQPDQARLDAFAAIARLCAGLKERVCEAVAIGNTAGVLRDSGKTADAIKAYYVALALVDPQVDSAAVGIYAEALAFTLADVGDYDRAIQSHQDALAAYATFGECSGVARSLYGIGSALLSVGDIDQALRFYRLALERKCETASVEPVSRGADVSAASLSAVCIKAAESARLDTEERKVASWITWDLGDVLRSIGEPEAALTCHQHAVNLVVTRNQQLGVRLEGVRDLLALGRTEEARQIYATLEKSIATTSPYYRRQADDVHAELLASGGETGKAVDALSAVAKAFEEAWQFERAFFALSRRAALVSPGSAESDEYFAAADTALERVRLMSLDPVYSASLFSTGRRIYLDWMASLASANVGPDDTRVHTFTGLAISERSRSRLLSQLVDSFQDANVSRGSYLSSLSTNTTALLEKLEADQKAEQASANTQVADVQEATPVLAEQHHGFDHVARSAAIAELEEFQRGLAPNVTAIEYLLGDTRSHAWVLRKDSITQVELPDARTIRAAATAARDTLVHGVPLGRAREALGNLHALIYAPLAPFVKGNELKIVADDALHEIPFAALWDAARGEYLVERASIAYLPSLQFAVEKSSADRTTPRGAPSLLVGDAAYDRADAEERCNVMIGTTNVGSSAHSLTRLPDSGSEVTSIAALLTRDSQKFTQLTGCQANRDRVLATRPAVFRYIHFATHATADLVSPQRSAIHLSPFDEKGASMNGILTAGDLLENPFTAELVVLSGCDTAGGKRFGGEGALGLSFSMLARGSRHVISTLWKVGDVSSAFAMQRLYTELVVDHERPVDALRAAQLAVLAQEKWSHPVHWAAYVLLGR
jgi:CHAT domain-containing protein/tetratricopeptide (TPR) repeat protein